MCRWMAYTGEQIYLERLLYEPDGAAHFHPLLARIDLAAYLDPRAAAERRTSHGGTAGSEVDRQAAILRAMLDPSRSID